MKNYLILLACCLGLVHLAEAQSFYWGYPAALSDETEKSISHVAEDGKVYRISSHYDIGIFNYRISADVFTADDLQRTNTVDLAVRQPAMGSAMTTHHSLFQKEGLTHVFFSRDTDRSTAAHNFFVQEVNIDSGEKTELRLLTSIAGKSNSNNGQFATAQSPNGMYYAVLKEGAFFKKELEKIELLLLDKDLNEVAKLEHEFEYEADRVPKHSLHVDDAGNVYVMKRLNLPKQKPFHNIYTWQRNSSALTVQSLRQDDNYQVAQVYPHFEDGSLFVTALLTSDGSTTFGLSVDVSGRNSGTLGSALLCARFSPKGEHLYTVRNDFERPVSNLSIKEVLSDSNGLWVVMERMHADKKSNTTDKTATNIVYSYSYLSNGFMLSLVDATTGTTKWNRLLETNEPNTANDNGSFLSVLPLLHEGKLVLIYNETRDLRSGAVRNPLLRRFPIMEVITPTGETANRDALTDAGVGVTEDEMFDLDTAHIFKVSEGKYLLRARNRGEYKYGYLQL